MRQHTGSLISRKHMMQFLSIITQSAYLMMEALEGFEDFKRGIQVIHTVKYADDLVLPAKAETVLQSMTG